MTTGERQLLQDFYRDKVTQIRIGASIDSAGIRNILAQIDELYNQAYFDALEAYAEAEKIDAEYTAAAHQFIFDGKTQGMTDEKARAHSKIELHSQGYVDKKLEASQHKEFMEAIIQLLKEKKEMVGLNYGLLKIESSMTTA